MNTSAMSHHTNATSPASELFHHDLEVWFAVAMTTCCVGSILHILLLLVIIINKFYRHGSVYLIAHLTLLELSMCAIHLPLNLCMTFLAGHVAVFNDSACPYVHFFFLWTRHAGHWSNCLLAINRYTAAFFPHCYAGWSTRPALTVTIVAAWALSFLINFPMCFGVGGRYRLQPPWRSCGPQSDGSAYLTVTNVVGVYVPEGLLFTLYAGVMVRLQMLWRTGLRSHRTGPLLSPAALLQAGVRARRRFTVVKVMFASSVWYGLCYFSNSVIVSAGLQRWFTARPVAQLWLRLLLVCGYAFSPVCARFLSMLSTKFCRTT